MASPSALGTIGSPPSRVSLVPGGGRGSAGGEAWCSLTPACHIPLLLSRVPSFRIRGSFPLSPESLPKPRLASWLSSPCRTNFQHPVPPVKVSGVSVPHSGVGPRGLFRHGGGRQGCHAAPDGPALCRFFLSVRSSSRCAVPSLLPAGQFAMTGLPALGTPGTQIHAG